MASIIPFIGNCAFGPDEIAAISHACDKACKMLHDRGQTEIVPDVVARLIVTCASDGSRDPDQLCSRAVQLFDRISR